MSTEEKDEKTSTEGENVDENENVEENDDEEGKKKFDHVIRCF